MPSEDGSENGGAETGGRSRGQKQGAETRADASGNLSQQVLLELEYDCREIFGVNCLRKTYTTSATPLA